MIYFQLFLSFFQIGLLSFGGGYAAMPLIQGQVVQGHGWLSMSEFTDLITISQMTPGPIAVNSATFVGIKIAGIPGALVATFGCILPSCILVTLLAKLYLKYREIITYKAQVYADKNISCRTAQTARRSRTLDIAQNQYIRSGRFFNVSSSAACLRQRSISA